MTDFEKEFERPTYATDARATRIATVFKLAYGWMCAGLALSGLVAWYTAASGLAQKILLGPGMWVCLIAEVALVWILSASIRKLSVGAACLMFIGYAALNGLTLSVVFLAYKIEVIQRVFFITAAMFGGLAVFGTMTKSDLSQVGAVCGMLWGMIPGFFRAVFNVNEVIVCIMTNWIAANIVSWVFGLMPHLINSGSGKSGYLITTAVTGNGTPTLGLNQLFKGSYIDAGIIVAIILAVGIHVMLTKTTFGYELRACGANRYGAKYAGMSEKRNIILSMAIAGGLAAIGGALYYLNPGIEFKFDSAYQKLPDYGFNGIPAALLGSNNPIAVIFVALFIRYLNTGGGNLTSAGFNKYIADVIIALIIYFAGFSKLFKDIMSRRKARAAVQTATANSTMAEKAKVTESAVPDAPPKEEKQTPVSEKPGKEGDE